MDTIETAKQLIGDSAIATVNKYLAHKDPDAFQYPDAAALQKAVRDGEPGADEDLQALDVLIELFKVARQELVKQVGDPRYAKESDRVMYESFGTMADAILKLKAESDPWEGWGRPTMINEIMELRPPIEYAVKGLMSFIDNLIVVYGAPSSFKSFLMQDLAIHIAMGKDWLPPELDGMGRPDGELKPVEVNQHPIMWVDGEQGKRRTMDRFQELGFGYNVDKADCPIFLWSMPNPMLDASRDESLKKLMARIKSTGAKIVFIDCLVTISGDAEENTADMAPVMYGLKRVGEQTGAIMVVIHHSRKQYATNGRSDEEDLRGHSSIKGAADVALLVRREGINSRVASIIPVKVRDGKGDPITAQINPYTGNDGIRSVQFVQVSQDSQDRATENSVVSAVLDVLRTNGPTVQGKLIDYVQGRLKKGGVHTGKSGEKYVANILKQMAADNKVKVSSGKNRSMIYEIA